jgi:phenylalanyl-tRNA synthetase beta chain
MQNKLVDLMFSEGITIEIGNETIVELGVVKIYFKTFWNQAKFFYANFDWDLILKENFYEN